MLKTFQCPTCAAPLSFEGRMLIDCNYCGGKIIAPADIAGKEDLEQNRKLEAVNSIIKTFFSNANVESKGGSYVIDLRSSSKRAQQNLGSAASEIKKGHTSEAMNVFTETFGVESKDAHKIVDAIGHGKGFDTSALRIYPQVPRKSPYTRVILFIVIGVIFIFVAPLLFSILIMLIASLIG